ncbi:Cytochrome oxidase biogenesis protein Sco1/SenC/PrrC, putative copper metallochaperone [Candidatus Rhodobacter oscarellae]|uniref:Cytochrome oxidase biogenesis protein Sco1/SenC/PrrC, putative copper metallochaperone n=1 Tax=Candidatus Rhodobacter oscarellae TaxID=1675527 RepID=A0A0J9ECX5_9RHOB|nr:SCO family protein [Candidatus Rhodobacter lobularis]KMW60622.1 Cytochrome oxidase biogenesis protein Sco1/SenC/PrrC, putative copper metallochaperone [Candidatus Rhodobacter lobularis]
MQRQLAVLAGAAVAAVLAVTFVAPMFRSADARYAQCRASSIAGGAATIGGPFTLVNGAGETVTDRDVLTKPTLVYFGYTFCPDVCPLDAARNAEAIDLLTAQGHDAQAVFISIDPERDTPEVVDDYARYMHEDMIGLTGSLEQVKAASKAYKTYFRKQDAENEFYLVDHSTQTYLMLPEVGFVEFFKRADSSEAMAQRTACFIENT